MSNARMMVFRLNMDPASGNDWGCRYIDGEPKLAFDLPPMEVQDYEKRITYPDRIIEGGIWFCRCTDKDFRDADGSLVVMYQEATADE
ncbi:MAG: hypothetical protein GY941_14110 [Planctomycetes bacterium]|nr:hypothetical protein [Planctomycetota bacterium]